VLTHPDNVVVTWVAPDNGGSPITAYTVEFLQADGTSYSTELTNCDGSTTGIRDATTCTVPVSAFKATPFELPWGSEVWARVKAWNYYGNYGYSGSGNGAVITTYPDAPTTLVER